MGQWTPEYCDDVLRSKMKTLVTGAIMRSKKEPEKGEPTITYQAFVEDLDEGDTFTTTLIEILVKEIAERRTRPNPVDRRLISERTQKALNSQAVPMHVYRGRTAVRLPERRVSDFSIVNVDGVDLMDDDDFDTRGAIEGVRLSHELYDAYLPPSHDISGSPALSPEPHELDDDASIVNSPRARSPPGFASLIYRSNPWANAPSSSSSTLTRQNSIRRPTRSRTIDFNDFTTRRRSTIRQVSEQDNQRQDGWAEVALGYNPVSRPSRLGDLTRASSTSSTTIPARRFFPLGVNPWGSRHSWTDPVEAAPPTIRDEAPAAAVDTQSSSQLWYSFTSAPVLPSPPPLPPARRSSSVDLTAERRQVVAPRLRRGGLRPPESMLSRFVSPVVEEPHPQPTSENVLQNIHAGAPQNTTAPVGRSESPSFSEVLLAQTRAREEHSLASRSVSPLAE